MFWRAKGLSGVLVLLTACATAPRPEGARPEGAGAEAIAAVVDAVTRTPPLHRTHWGIEVRDPAANRLVYRLDAEKHFVPASNAKLVVTAVGLAELGPEYRYRTDVHALGGPADSIAAGLVVVGRGDPTLSARFHENELAPLLALADSIAAAGIRRVAGDLVVDASYFEVDQVHSTWEVGDLPWAYAAPVSAFGIGEGTSSVVIEPGARPGDPATLRLEAPPGAIALANRVATAAAGTRRRLDVVRRTGTDSLEIVGVVPVGAPADTVRFAVPDPADYAGRGLEFALERRGIAVDGEVRVVHDTAAAAALREARGRRVATWTSPALAEIVAAILKPSQNWIAEQLLKTLGAERGDGGSWDGGLEVERRYLVEEVGIDTGAVTLRDASGLSAQNLLTPQAVVQLLSHARRQEWGEAYHAALPRPGEEDGTLERRLRGLEERVMAKTGTITHVNSLSGYARTADGRELVFSILTNASGRPASEVRRAIDRIVEAIVEHGGGR